MAAIGRPYPGYHDPSSKKHKRNRYGRSSVPLIHPTYNTSPGHHGRRRRDYQPDAVENIYDDIDGQGMPHRRDDGYGATHEPSVEAEISLRSPEETGDFTDAPPSALLVPPVLLRDIPCQLSDGTETEVHYTTGQYTKLVVLVLFFSLLPFGLCFLGFLPFCLKCKWSKDINHIDPVTRVSVGRFVRGTIDAPQIIHYQRIVQKERRTASLRQVTRQPSSSVPQQIILGPKPVTLPDETLTMVKKRVGFGNLLAAIITLCVCTFIPFGWVFLPILVLSCFGMSCLKDIEHIHRHTGNIVGVYYRCQS